jgi:mannosyltransferase OCH1-like enzyme
MVASTPDFEHLFFDDRDAEAFVARECPDHLRLYRALKDDIRHVDLFRYLAVQRLGGFYFDTDVHLEQPLDGLLAESALFAFEKLTIFPWLQAAGMHWQVGNYAFAAAPGHPFLAAVIAELAATANRRERLVPLWTPPSVHRAFRIYHGTGPGLVSRVLLAQPRLSAEVRILLPPNSTTWNRFGRFARHACAGTWKRAASPLGDRWMLRRNRRARRAFGAADPETLAARQHPSVLTWEAQAALIGGGSAAA